MRRTIALIVKFFSWLAQPCFPLEKPFQIDAPVSRGIKMFSAAAKLKDQSSEG